MPTLQQYATYAAAAAALSMGSMYIDATGNVKVLVPPPMVLTPLSTGNILLSQNPALVTTWSDNTLAFNTTGQYGTWGLSSSLLTSIGFSWTAPWMFVLKCKSTGSNLRACLAIDPIANWTNSDGLYTECIANQQTPYVYVRSSGAPQTVEAFGAPYVVVNNIPVDTSILSGNGCFIVYSWNGTQAKIEFLTSTGTLIYSSQINRTMANGITPISFYTDVDQFNFLKGMYFNQGYQAYSVWSSLFA
jgi:hypothetical protein